MGNFIHKEAFCLMQYECSNCAHRETIWNSRDGVTPSGCMCPSCGRPNLMHVDFWADEYASNHILNKYQKYWRDGTPEEAEKNIRNRIKMLEMQGYEASKEQERLLLNDVKGEGSWEFQKGWPIIDIKMGN